LKCSFLFVTASRHHIGSPTVHQVEVTPPKEEVKKEVVKEDREFSTELPTDAVFFPVFWVRTSVSCFIFKIGEILLQMVVRNSDGLN